MKSLSEFLTNTAASYPNKLAFKDEFKEITFKELYDKSRAIASSLDVFKKPVVLLFDQDVDLVVSMNAILYAGGFYVVLDSKMPLERISKIVDNLNPVLLIYEDKYENKASEIKVESRSFKSFEGLEADDIKLSNIYKKVIDRDIAYAIYTSGSTGVPKGTVVSHDAVMKYIDWFINTFNINNNITYGAQMPFYFSASISSYYSCLKCGFSYYIIPKSNFIFPINLVRYLNEYKIDTIYWVPSALGVLVNFDVFSYEKPEYLKTILFAGEVMPVKFLNYYIKHLGSDILYANLFGPTETVDICTYYIVDRDFDLSESIPIGYACNNCDSFVLDKNDELSNEGELCVRGSFLASGYYNMPEKTKEAFVLNPLNKSYPELIYRTGDLVKYNEAGELIYIGRKDFQIKHMGYRIELCEIESQIMAIEKIKACLCVYNKDEDRIVLIYEGRVDKDLIYDECKKRLPRYMFPNDVVRVKQMIYNSNGKIDRTYYKNNFKEILKNG